MNIFRTSIYGLAALASASLVLTACQDDVDAPAIENPVASSTPNTTLAEFKEMFWQDDNNYCVHALNPDDPTQRIVIHGRVTSSDEQSNVFKFLVIQDETAALTFSIDSYNLYLNYRRGQEIVMDVTDMFVGKYAGQQQMGDSSYYDVQRTPQVTFMSIERFRQKAELNGIPDISKLDTLQLETFAELLTNTPEVQRKYQSQFVRLKNVYFEDGGKKKFSVYHENTNDAQNRNIIDRNGQSIIVRTSGYSTFWNEMLPEGNLDIVGTLTYFNGSWRLILNDREGVIEVGDRPGTKEKPYTVDQVVALESANETDRGWIRGYIVGAVAPEVETVTSNTDIEWAAPTVLANTLVIGPSTDTNDFSRCLVVALPPESALRQYGNLRSNPSNLGKEILIQGSFEKYMGTYGITGNNGTASEFEIEGVTIDNGEIPAGSGTEESPYNVAQIVALNPSSTTTAVETGVWVKGYIVGSMPTGGSSTTLSGTNFSTQDAATTNLVLGPTPDCTEYSKCIGVQLTTSIRGELALANVPGNLGKELTIKGDVMKYCGGPGLKNPTTFKLGEGGGDTPTPDPDPTAVTSLDVNFESGSLPSDWKNVRVSGDKTWYVTSFDNNYYAAMTGYKGTTPPFDQWLISPAIDLSKVTDKNLTFDSQVNGYGSTTTTFGVYVLTSADPATGNPVQLNATLATAPSSGYSGFVPSGNVSLAAYSGTVYIGFRYYATQDANYATWCVDNIRLNAGTAPTPDPDPDPDPDPNPGDCVTVNAASMTVPGTTTAAPYTITIDKAQGKTEPIVHESTSTVRLYANNTIKFAGAQMVKIVFTMNTTSGAKRYTEIKASAGTVATQADGDATVTWTGNASDVTFTVDALGKYGSEPDKPGQFHFTKIEIYAAE